MAGVSRLKQGPGGIPYRVAIAQSDLDAAQQGVKQANEGLQSAIRGGKRTLEVADQEIKSARTATLQAKTAVAAAEQAVSAMRLLCPLDGIANTVNAGMRRDCPAWFEPGNRRLA